MVSIADYGTTLVTEERGRWVVSTIVAFPDTTVCHRITDYHTETMAQIAADLIHRAMNRSLR